MQMKKLFLCTIMLSAFSFLNAQVNTSQLWVNELHYDGSSAYGTSDANEFIEFVVHNDLLNDATELAKYKLVLYALNGYDLRDNTAQGKGLPYNETSRWYSEMDTEHALATVSADGSDGFQQCPIVGTNYTTLYKQLPILMDLPAAMAIIYDDASVVQLISYESVFKIQNSTKAGAAADMTTELMTNSSGQPVSESTLTTQNHSMQLEGNNGEAYSDFTWDDNPLLTATPCAQNSNQSFAAVLPVELVSFTGKASEKAVDLTWKTATESNNKGFFVERKAEGEREFSDLTFVEGANNSDTKLTYKFSDRDITTDEIYQYRLRQTDFDGAVAYSSVIVVKTDGKAASLQVSPNPARALVTINLKNIEANTNLEVRSIDGTVMQNIALEENAAQSVTLDISRWATGVYVVKYESDTRVRTEKLIVR